MLESIQLKDLKSFPDTGNIPLRKINILIGANNAGKTTFLSAIELFFRSLRASGPEGPLAFDSMASFTSFDSTLRRHWTKTTQRPTAINMKFGWVRDRDGSKTKRGYEFECASQGTDDTIVVRRATYSSRDGAEPVTAVRRVDQSSGRVGYDLQVGKKQLKDEDGWFHQMMPVAMLNQRRQGLFLGFETRPTQLEVVNPYRPIPRSFYVLDDPNLGSEDRTLLTYLIRVWSSAEQEDKVIRKRITDSLERLGLTRQFEISQVSKRIGPKVIEIRVAPTSSRQKVTIADAGFGLSQVLPLAVYDARLSGGTLIAYQPEVHLHPYAQSRLADIFVESASRKNQLFIESHSTDLILRLQAKIVRGDVAASDVCVLCFENKSGKTSVSPMYFEDSGAPSMVWPAGFVDTSLNLARDLTSARITKLQQAK